MVLSDITSLYGSTYPPEFYPLREIVRARDQYQCVVCGAGENGRAHDVHHIDYNKYNNSEFNLVTLCHPCHAKTSWGQDDWQQHLTDLVESKFPALE